MRRKRVPWPGSAASKSANHYLQLCGHVSLLAPPLSSGGCKGWAGPAPPQAMHTRIHSQILAGQAL